MSEPRTTADDSGTTTRRRGMVRAAMRTTEGRLGVALTVLVAAVALLGPYLAGRDPDDFAGRPYASRSGSVMFGTDYLGHDVMARFLHGGRSILVLAVLATALGVTAGVALGIVAGSTKGAGGEVLMRSQDLLLAFPPLVLALLFLSLLGSKGWLICLLVALAHVPRIARIVRASTARVVEEDYVLACRAIGVPRRSLLIREILPNVRGPILVEAGLSLTFSIIIIAGLSFLGFGSSAGADWGRMIFENQPGLTAQPWPVLLPTLAIALLTVGTNLVTDSIARVSGVSMLEGSE